MKTAMQELIEWTNQYQGKMISADQVVLQAHNLLEKEKEQIIEAINAWCSDDNILTPEQYYNQTYKPETI
jgi:hypothetical protein